MLWRACKNWGVQCVCVCLISVIPCDCHWRNCSAIIACWSGAKSPSLGAVVIYGQLKHLYTAVVL